ncbi:MAG TPA: hypothetical protein VKB64_08565 [Gaiellaceae bacterium]|nr:hypothetical protein [Gaiellaceae bacterium]
MRRVLRDGSSGNEQLLLHARRRPAAVRVVATTLSVVAGAGLAVLTLPAADHLQDNVTLHAGFDGD